MSDKKNSKKQNINQNKDENKLENQNTTKATTPIQKTDVELQSELSQLHLQVRAQTLDIEDWKNKAIRISADLQNLQKQAEIDLQQARQDRAVVPTAAGRRGHHDHRHSRADPDLPR